MTLVMPTRILVVGGGGREHALAWKLGREPGVNEVLVAPGSAGIADEPHVRCRRRRSARSGRGRRARTAHASELVVVGPEAPLAAGVADALGEAGIAVFGPSRAAARLETSKAFCHEVADGGRASGRHGRGRSRARRGGRGASVRARARGGRRGRRPQGRRPRRRQGRHRHGRRPSRRSSSCRRSSRVARPTRPPSSIEERLDGSRGERHRDLRRDAGRRPARRARPQAAVRRRRRPEHRRHGRVLAAARPRRRRRRAACSRPSTGRSWPRWPAAAPRSVASSTPA